MPVRSQNVTPHQLTPKLCTNLIINHRRGIEFASRAEDRGSIPDRDGPKSLKHVATAPQPNDQQQV